MIRIENLEVSRGGEAVVQGVSVDIPSGGITALVGPNGAGKSTLLHAISGLLPLSAGSVEVEGQDIHALAPRERARLLALLTQSEHVTARLTVGDLVAFGRWPHHRGRPTERDRAAVAASLMAFGLETLADRRLDTLSGGQRQRAFVAMTHAQDTPWLLLDEPLSALDPRHARDIMERLHGLTREDRRSVVVVLHDLGTAARYADHVVALKGGQLAAAGPREAVLTTEMLSALFETGLSVERVRGRDVVIPD